MRNNFIDYKSIGQRLRAHRIAASLKAEDIAQYIGISRAAVYRLEKGEIVKIDTLEKLAILLNTSLTGLLGVDNEYYSNASGFFERMRQLEDSSTHIYSHFDPFSYLLTSDDYDKLLKIMLLESSYNQENLSSKEINTLSILFQRKKNQLKNKSCLFNLIGIQQIERFLHLGLIGSLNLPPSKRMERVLLARNEVNHLINTIEENTNSTEIAISQDPIPSLTFQIFYQKTHPLSVATSPFRLGELPNITNGIASVTNSHEAIVSYRNFFDRLWDKAVKGNDAIALLRKTLERY